MVVDDRALSLLPEKEAQNVQRGFRANEGGLRGLVVGLNRIGSVRVVVAVRREAKRLTRQMASRLRGLPVLQESRVRLVRVNRSGYAESGLVIDDCSIPYSNVIFIFVSHRLVRLLSI